MDFYFTYFIGCVVLFSVWLGIFLFRKDLRKEMFFGSLLGLPFGFSEFLFVPEYWTPPSLFNLIERVGFGVESLLFGFLVGGIASVIYEFFQREKVVPLSNAELKKHFLAYALVVGTFLSLEFIFPTKSIYNLMLSFVLGTTYILVARGDLMRQIIFSGALLSVVYFLLFLLVNALFPDFVHTVYSLENFLGVMVLGVPIEEIMFAFSVGACWSTLYEFINGYRTKPIKKT